MTFGKVLAATAFALGLVACGATPYDQSTMVGGYTDDDMGNGVWRVAYGGNSFTTIETAQTYWLYRCASIALENGYQGFKVLSDIKFVRLMPEDGTRSLAIPADYYYSPINPNIGPQPGILGDIQLLKAPVTPMPPKVFDAAALKAALEPYVKGKHCKDDNVCPHAHFYLHSQDAA